MRSIRYFKRLDMLGYQRQYGFLVESGLRLATQSVPLLFYYCHTILHIKIFSSEVGHHARIERQAILQ